MVSYTSCGNSAQYYEKKAAECNLAKDYQAAADAYIKASKIWYQYSKKGTTMFSKNPIEFAKCDMKKAIRHLRKVNGDIAETGALLRTYNLPSGLEKITETNPSLSFVLPILSIIAFSIALISSSFSITGNIISDATNSTANYLALGCFATGSVLALIYLKRTIKKKKLIKEKLSKKKSTKKKK